MRSLRCILAPALTLSLSLQAQSPAAATPLPSPHDTLAVALQRLRDADNDVRRFTYIEHEKFMHLNPMGQPSGESTRVYEATWINDLPYMRLLAVDDLPLAGKALAQEQKRYDKAVAKKKELGEKARGKIDGYRVTMSDANPHASLTPSYTLTETAQIHNGPDILHLIDARLLPGASHVSQCPWHFQFWVSEKQQAILRYTADPSGDTSPACEDAFEDNHFILVDGIPKLSAEAVRFHTLLKDGDGRYRFDGFNATFENYRRFGAIITLRPGNPIPPDTAP